jgi:peptidyl-prolyl cis-trans isomerase A (cyclophilin A)
MRNMMLIALVLATGCEHTNKSDSSKTVTKSADPPADPSPGARKADTQKTVPTPPGGSDEVRPPTAADLAEYTKGIPGNGSKLMAKIETSQGTINCELYPDKAPMTVANFVGLATGKKPWLNPKTGNVEKGVPYFDGLTFHRVMAGFMIQGGDPLGEGRGGPGYKFGDELSPDMDMGPLTLAMANAGPTTNGSQFFIMEDATRKDLASKHTIFGMCKEMDVVKKITGVPATATKPNTPVTMKVTISKG